MNDRTASKPRFRFSDLILGEPCRVGAKAIDAASVHKLGIRQTAARPLVLILIALLEFGCDATPISGLFDGTERSASQAPDPAGLQVTPTRPEIRVGETVAIRVTLTGAGSEKAIVSWSLLNPSVAHLASTGPPCGDRCATLTGLTEGVSVMRAEATFGGTHYGAHGVVTVSAQ
jgi:hypothetical protein